MALSETAFAALAEATLNRLADMAESLDGDATLEIELANGILSIELSNGRSFLVNKHTPSQQLWLSSPLSGGLHFDYDEDAKGWVLKDGSRLDTLLRAELDMLMAEE